MCTSYLVVYSPVQLPEGERAEGEVGSAAPGGVDCPQFQPLWHQATAGQL